LSVPKLYHIRHPIRWSLGPPCAAPCLAGGPDDSRYEQRTPMHTSYSDCRGAKCTPNSPAACHAAVVHTPQCGIDDGAHSSIPAEASHTRTRAHTQTNAHCAHTFTITRTHRRIAGRIRRAGFQGTLTKPQRDAREGPRFELTTVSRRTTRLDLVPLLLLGCSFQLGH
jgi:hypothetical protein